MQYNSCYLNQMSRLFHLFSFCKLPLGWLVFNTSLVAPYHKKCHGDEPYLITGEPPLYGWDIADTANPKGQNPLGFFWGGG